MKISCFKILILILFPVWLYGQDTNQNKFIENKIRETMLEKLRVDPYHLNNIPQNNSVKLKVQENEKSIETNGELQVTNNSIPESEVHAVINPTDTNNIVLSPIRYKSNGVDPLICPVIYSKDFGQTWHESSFLTEPPDTNGITIAGGGDPVLAFDADGRLYFTWINLYIKNKNWSNGFWMMSWAFSDDGGATWNRSVNDTIGFSTGSFSPSTNFNIVYDKEWISTDFSNSPYRKNLYVVYCKFSNSPKFVGIYVRKKQAGNNGFDPGEILVSGTTFKDVQFSNVAVDDKGFVHVVFYGSKDKQNYSLWHSISMDGGVTFSNPAEITKVLKPTGINGITTSRLYPAPQIVIDNSSSVNNGNIYLTFTASGTNTSTNTGADIYLTRSIDSGKTWSTPVVVNNDSTGSPKDQFYSSITVNPNGVIVISWYDGRNSTDNSLNNNVRYYMAYSFDGGLTFTNNFSVSTVSSDFQNIRNQNGTFGIGEYNQVISTGYYAIPVWSDGRKNDGDLDIYAAFIPISTHPVNIREISAITDKVSVSAPFPQPAGDHVSVSVNLTEKSNINTVIFDLSGKVLLSKNFIDLPVGKNIMKIETGTLSAGQYILAVKTDFGYFTRDIVLVK